MTLSNLEPLVLFVLFCWVSLGKRFKVDRIWIRNSLLLNFQLLLLVGVFGAELFLKMGIEGLALAIHGCLMLGLAIYWIKKPSWLVYGISRTDLIRELEPLLLQRTLKYKRLGETEFINNDTPAGTISLDKEADLSDGTTISFYDMPYKEYMGIHRDLSLRLKEIKPNQDYVRNVRRVLSGLVRHI